MENKVLDSRKDFEELRQIFFCHNLCYGDNTKVVLSDDIEIGESDWFNVMISFIRPEDKQLFVNIIIWGYDNEERGEYHDNYFFTWYGNRPFEVATLNGVPITQKVYEELLRILKLANFKISPEELQDIIVTNAYCEAYNIKKI